MNKTIEPAIQEAILDILPDDYDRSMCLLCQLLANMALCGDEPWALEKVLAEIRSQHTAYTGA